MKKTKLAILVVMALLAAGCGKIRTCYCMNNSYFDIIDTALHDSVPYPIYKILFFTKGNPPWTVPIGVHEIPLGNIYRNMAFRCIFLSSATKSEIPL